MTDTATPTPGNRLDAAIEAAKVAMNDLRQQLAAKAAEVGQEVNAKVDEIQARIDEIQAARAEESTSQTQGTPEAPEPGVGAV
jgi:outer membrane protein TolC